MGIFSRYNWRSLVLMLAAIVVLGSLAVPARAYLRESREISRLQAALTEQEKAIEVLQNQKVRLRDKAYLQSLIRDRLNYVFPGEIGFVVLDKETSTAITSVPGALVPNDDSAWYSKLWTSTKLADEPQKKNDPLVVNSTDAVQ